MAYGDEEYERIRLRDIQTENKHLRIQLREREAHVAALRAGYDYLHTWLEVDGSLCFCRSTREELAAQLGQHLIYCEQVRSFLNDTASLARVHDAQVIRDARKQMKLEAARYFVDDGDTFRWLCLDHGGDEAEKIADIIRALPDDPPPQEK